MKKKKTDTRAICINCVTCNNRITYMGFKATRNTKDNRYWCLKCDWPSFTDSLDNILDYQRRIISKAQEALIKMVALKESRN